MNKTILILVLLVAAPAFGQSKQQSTPHAKRHTRPILTQSFDTTAEKLPLNFEGHNAALVAAALQKLNLEKGQFESTAQYNERLAMVPTKTLFGSMTTASTFAFVQWASNSYDADKGVMTVDLSFSTSESSNCQLRGETRPEELEDLHHRQQVGFDPEFPTMDSYYYKRRVEEAEGHQYKGKIHLVVDQKSEVTSAERVLYTNALGGMREGYEGFLKNLMVGMEVPEWLKSTGLRFNACRDLRAQLPMGGVTAQQLDDSVRVLLIGPLAPPFVERSSNYYASTFDSPGAIYETNTILKMQLEQVWLFNVKTGEVIARYRPQH